jgi:branched-chain amino acid transport system permease protein
MKALQDRVARLKPALPITVGRSALPFAVAILLAVVMDKVIGPAVGATWSKILLDVGIAILLAGSLNVVNGYAGQFSIGHAGFMLVGAYAAAWLTFYGSVHWFGTKETVGGFLGNGELLFLGGCMLGGVIASVFGVVVGLPSLRLRGDYLAIVTLGFAEIIRILLKSDLMTAYTAGPRGIRDIAGPSLFGKSFISDVDFMYLIILAVLVVTFLANRLRNSRTGKAWFAINLDETVARATGVNAFTSKLLALAISAAIAGLAGALFASRNQFTGPDDHALMVSINVLCLVIVGGIGNIPGVFLGAFALKGLPEILRETENYRLLIFGVLLIVMMRLRPEGFLPARRPELEKATVEHPANEVSS